MLRMFREHRGGWKLACLGLALCLAAAPAFAVPLAANSAKISGSFVQPWFVEGWDAGQWASELADLKAAGVDDHIIWQWTVDSFNKLTYYPSALPGFKKSPDMKVEDAVGLSLAAAKKAGLKVWLGLNWTDDWWNKYANDKAWLENEFAIGREVAKELWQRYGKEYKDTIAGFYYTMEVDNDNFQSKERQDLIKAVYRQTGDLIHRLTKKPVMIAPFCSDVATVGPEGWRTMWENILAGAGIDVVNMQDGCGASDDGKTTHVSLDTVGTWFAAMRAAINKASPKTQLWSDLETFDMDEKWNCFPARDFGRIAAQIAAVAPYVDRISSFAVMHYQTRVGAEEAWAAEAAKQYAALKAQQGKQ